MTIHTKTISTLAAASCFAVVAMVVFAADPDYTPTFAVNLAPYAFGAVALALVSYGLDLISGR